MKNTEKRLKSLRKKIDQADRALLRALGDRQAAVQKIGILKAKTGMAPHQKARWARVLNAAVKLGKKSKLDPVFTKSIFERIHSESIRIQKKVKKL